MKTVAMMIEFLEGDLGRRNDDGMIQAIIDRLKLTDGRSVCQRWMNDIPLRMQSVLLLGLRGPDNVRAPEIKKLCRWLRGLAFRPGNPNNVVEFMKTDLPDRIDEKGELHRELEFVPEHYFTHLMHALQVVGYMHPNATLGERARELFEDMANMLHLPPEDYATFYSRLGPMKWPEDAEPEDAQEAFEIIKRTDSFSDRDRRFMTTKHN